MPRDMVGKRFIHPNSIECVFDSLEIVTLKENLKIVVY